MNKLFLVILMCLFIAAPALLLHADEGEAPPSRPARTTASVKDSASSYELAVGDKAARGVKNILFGWTEIPKRVVDISQETNNPFWGLLAGTFQGTLKAMARTVSGVSDVVTAPIAADKDPFIQADIDLE